MKSYIPIIDSTNNLLKRLIADGEQQVDVANTLDTVYTFYQTAGRGQRGNSWESEAGKNLLFSTLFVPTGLKAVEQFRLSELVSLAVLDVVKHALGSYAQHATIKWPNDIYIDDKKVCGILVETRLRGADVAYSIAGVGLNVNQQTFLSSAPNPSSLFLFTHTEYDLHEMMQSLISAFQQRLPLLSQGDELHCCYMRSMYRGVGYWPFVEREVSIEPTSIETEQKDNEFLARIVDVDEMGQLCLETKGGAMRRYHFKQIRYVIR